MEEFRSFSEKVAWSREPRFGVPRRNRKKVREGAKKLTEKGDGWHEESADPGILGRGAEGGTSLGLKGIGLTKRKKKKRS